MKVAEKRLSNVWPTITAVFIAFATTIITGVFSYSIGKQKAENEAAVAFSFPKEQFDARLEEYPKLWKILLPISSHAEPSVDIRGGPQDFSRCSVIGIRRRSRRIVL